METVFAIWGRGAGVLVDGKGRGIYMQQKKIQTNSVFPYEMMTCVVIRTYQ